MRYEVTRPANICSTPPIIFMDKSDGNGELMHEIAILEFRTGYLGVEIFSMPQWKGRSIELLQPLKLY